MYRWYQQSECCIVYLEDAKDTSHSRSKQVTFKRMLAGSRWITRGWTLQELIAPPVVLFYDSSWHFVITKQSSLGTIRAVTGIPEYVLATGDLSRSSVAQKMAWSANRTTNRIEDLAYSLLGTFLIASMAEPSQSLRLVRYLSSSHANAIRRKRERIHEAPGGDHAHD